MSEIQELPVAAVTTTTTPVEENKAAKEGEEGPSSKTNGDAVVVAVAAVVAPVIAEVVASSIGGEEEKETEASKKRKLDETDVVMAEAAAVPKSTKLRKLNRKLINNITKSRSDLLLSYFTWREWEPVEEEYGDAHFFDCVLNVDVVNESDPSKNVVKGTNVSEIEWMPSKSIMILKVRGNCLSDAIVCETSFGKEVRVIPN